MAGRLSVARSHLGVDVAALKGILRISGTAMFQNFVATASYVVRPRGPLRWLDPGAFGTLGVGAGFALGAKLVHPNAEVCRMGVAYV